MAEVRIRRALKHRVPAAAGNALKIGDQVLVWREKLVENRIGEYVGPYRVAAVDNTIKMVYIRDCKIGAPRPFSITQVKQYYPPEEIAFSCISQVSDNLQCFRTPDTTTDIFATEVISPKDPRAFTSEMMAAKQAEIKNLLDKGAFTIILKEDIPRDANVLPGRFVLAINSTTDGEIKHKARYVIGGHRDKLKDIMVHSAQVLQPTSVRLLLALAQIFGFDVWSSDVKHAYIQSATNISRDVYIKTPVPQFELEPHQCLKLLQPLYGLCKSGDLWHETFSSHHRDELHMKPLKSDPVLYKWLYKGALNGLSGCYVDDILRPGTDSFKLHAKKTNELFGMADDELLPCDFTGFKISRNENGDTLIDQRNYLKRLDSLPFDASFSQFRSMRMRLAWLTNSRPDCMFEVSQLAQVTEEHFTASAKQHIKRRNRATTYAVKNHFPLLVPKLDQKSLRIIGFSDSSFGNNCDLSSQLGYVVFLADDTNSVTPLAFKSYNARRITRSAMAVEVIAFSDMSDYAIKLSEELHSLVSQIIPVHLLTDSKCLFDVIIKGSRTSEKRTMLDVAAAREAFHDMTISYIGFVRSSHSLADGFTKEISQQKLQTVLKLGHLHVHTRVDMQMSKL